MSDEHAPPSSGPGGDADAAAGVTPASGKTAAAPEPAGSSEDTLGPAVAVRVSLLMFGRPDFAAGPRDTGARAWFRAVHGPGNAAERLAEFLGQVAARSPVAAGETVPQP